MHKGLLIFYYAMVGREENTWLDRKEMTGVISVSGLSRREDHRLLVESMEEVLAAHHEGHY